MNRKHKKISKPFLLIIIASIILTNCNFVFQPEAISISQIKGYDQQVDATDGVYGQLCRAVNSIQFQSLNVNSDDIYFENTSNLYRSYYQSSGECKVSYYPFEVDYIYSTMYKIIASANNILVQYNIGREKQEVKEILGELLFIRAYCYFRLTRTYGQIPLILDTDISYNIKLPTFAEIYESIEYDLLHAIQYLPENRSRMTFFTPHQGVAKALLAEVYLSWAGYPVNDPSKYKLAASAAAEVIDNASEYNFKLLPDFANLWNSSGRYNNESVFSVYNSISQLATSARESLYSLFIHYSSENYRFQQGFSEDSVHFYYYYYLSSEVNFFNQYPESYRKDMTFFNHIYVPDKIGEYYSYDTGHFVFIDQIDECSRVAYKKFYSDTLLVSEREIDADWVIKYHVGNPRICLFRYAQTLLTYAEASARSSNLNEKTYEYVNMIRRRANKVDLYTPSEFDLPPGLSAEAFADSVVQERAWELAGEPEGRWFDLLRLEKIKETLKVSKIKEDNYLFNGNKLVNYFISIPEGDVHLNPNLNN